MSFIVGTQHTAFPTEGVDDRRTCPSTRRHDRSALNDLHRPISDHHGRISTPDDDGGIAAPRETQRRSSGHAVSHPALRREGQRTRGRRRARDPDLHSVAARPSRGEKLFAVLLRIHKFIILTVLKIIVAFYLQNKENYD
jgi:hypothetical protein